jgi:hypothetical protein
MPKTSNWETVLIGVFSVVLGIVAFAFSGSISNFFFVPIVIAVPWDYSDKLNDKQRRLSGMKSKLTGGTVPSSVSS